LLPLLSKTIKKPNKRENVLINAVGNPGFLLFPNQNTQRDNNKKTETIKQQQKNLN
jgi:hypothetical protein